MNNGTPRQHVCSPALERSAKSSLATRARVVFVSLLAGTVLAQTSIPIPAEKEHAVSLEGTWRFKLEQAPPPPRVLGAGGRPIPIECPTNFEAFYLPAYHENAAWHDLKVPGNWEMAGYSPATYHQPDNASGFYRLTFKVPRQWEGRLVKINFDGVQNGCEIWCNGRPVPVDQASWGRTNYHESGWTAWQADLTPVVKFGQQNLLALRVTKNTKGVECDTGDFFFLGGVHRSVTLFSVPRSHISDFSVRTSVPAEDRAEVTVVVQVEHASPGAKLELRLQGQPAIEAKPGADGRVTLRQVISHPKLWSAEFPNLYNLALEWKDANGKILERVTRRVGIREVAIRDGVFCLNGAPVKLAGICRHDVYPTLGTAVNADVWKQDLALMKSANFNAIRTSHYPYGSGFYDLCDELGFYVIDEEPFCWVNCDDPELAPAFEQRARETVQRDKNHACVVIWGIGNENKPGRDNALAAKITRELDPTRPRLISCQKADEGTEPVELDDAHYVTPQQIHRAEHDEARRAKWPMIYTENPNVWDVRNGPDYGSLELWGGVIRRTWRELWNDDHVAGTFLWEWQDRAVADKCPTKYYTFYPATGINVVKIKGVVDSFRNPRPEYFHIKMAQAPIALGAQPEVTAEGVVLQVTNRYSFTDLSALRVEWTLAAASKKLAHGVARLSLNPRSHGEARLALPRHALDRAETLRLDFNHPDGWNVATYQFELKPVSHLLPPVELLAGLKFPKFNLVTGKNVPDGLGWHRWQTHTGELAHVTLERSGQAAETISVESLRDLPLANVRALDAEVLLQPGAIPAGHLHAELAEGKLSYRFTWSGEKTDLYELGWLFSLPKQCDRFSWDRDAAWPWYPANHIGRPRGTAIPASAKAELTKVERPDAFDFDSTKFNCNWAALTDASGRGLCLLFSPKGRHHVRGGTGKDGSRKLIVDGRYSPPHDISSPIVKDLYTTLKAEAEITGSFQIAGPPSHE